MALGLVVTDQGNGTAQFAVSGSDGGSLNTVYWAPQYASVNGTLSVPWSVAGTITGNGSFTASIGQGNFWFTCTGLVSGLPVLSNAYNQSLVSTADPPHYLCLIQIRDRLRALNLSGILSADINETWLPRSVQDITKYPSVHVAPLGSEGQPFSLSGADDIDYPCLVLLLAAQNQDYRANLSRNLMWRWRVSMLLRHKPLGVYVPGIGYVNTTKQQYQLVVNPNFFLNSNVWWSAIVFLGTARETRINNP